MENVGRYTSLHNLRVNASVLKSVQHSKNLVGSEISRRDQLATRIFRRMCVRWTRARVVCLQSTQSVLTFIAFDTGDLNLVFNLCYITSTR